MGRGRAGAERSTQSSELPRFEVKPVLTSCLALQLLLLASTAPFYASFGLALDWRTMAGPLGLTGALLALRLYFWWEPGPSRERVYADMVLVVALLALISIVAVPAQYLAVALRRPLIDAWLAAADARLGVSVPALAAWTRDHPGVSVLLTTAYFTLLPQLWIAPVALGFWLRDRARLWEYCFHFHVCVVATLAGLAMFPAACAFTYYGFEATLDQTRFVQHFSALRAGTFHLIRLDDVEGLISMPSFHVAGALMVTWAFRGTRALLPLVGLNAVLIAATVMSGSHYLVDLLATGGLFTASVLLYRVLTGASPASPPQLMSGARAGFEAA